MADDERVVAVISPWNKLSDLVKRKFRVESLPTDRMVMVWRDDLQTKEDLSTELTSLGISEVKIEKKRVITKWQEKE